MRISVPGLLILLLASTAAADTTSASDEMLAKVQFARGVEAYRDGRFDDAVDAYERAYATLPLPAFLFNLGQCHRSRGDGARAVAYFEQYLAAQPDAKNRADVEALIASIRLESDEPPEPTTKTQSEVVAKTPKVEPAPDAVVLAEAAPTPAVIERDVPLTLLKPAPAALPRVADEPELLAAVTVPTTSAIKPADRPAVYETWWFWTIVGSTAIATASGIALASNLSDHPPPPAGPRGSLGGIDLR